MVTGRAGRVPGPADRARLAGWLDLAARGWAVFPVLPASKRPAITAWPDRATTDPDRIGRYFAAHLEQNAGVACGPSGLLVVDCDTPKPGTPAARPPAGPRTARRHWPGSPPRTAAYPTRGRSPPPRAGGTCTSANPLLIGQRAGSRWATPRGRWGRCSTPAGPAATSSLPAAGSPSGAYELHDDTDPAELPAWMTLRLAAGPSAAVSSAS